MSFHGNNYDEDFDEQHELHDEHLRTNVQQKNRNNQFNISDEEEVEADSSTDESTSVSSIAKATQLAAGIVRLEGAATTTTASEPHSAHEGHRDEEAHIDEHLETADHHQRGHEHDEAEEAENLDDSLNEQVKEMYDYFKEQSGNTEEESGADSSLNASANVQENLTSIMDDVLRINKAVMHAVGKSNEDHDDYDYDKVERFIYLFFSQLNILFTDYFVYQFVNSVQLE